MAAVLQPAKKSYFFGKGYRDVGNTIKGAWRRNFVSLRKFKNNITMSRISGDGRTTRLFKLVLNVLAMLSVLICGSIITAVVSVINIAVVFGVMAVIYLGFSIIWIVERSFRRHFLMGEKIWMQFVRIAEHYCLTGRQYQSVFQL